MAGTGIFTKKPLNDENNSKTFNVNISPTQQRIPQNIRQLNNISDFSLNGEKAPLGLSNIKNN